MLAHVNFVPVGSGDETKEFLGKAMKIIVHSEMDYQLTSMGIILEGNWNEVVLLIKKCHEENKHFTKRLVTNIVIDDRKDLPNRLRNNVLDIEYAVGDNLETHGLT